MHFYVHPETPVCVAQVSTLAGERDAIVVGHLFDPSHPDRSNEAVLKASLEFDGSFLAFLRVLSRLEGRFALIAHLYGSWYVFHDPCGLRSLYYLRRSREVYLASDPALLALVLDLELSQFGRRFSHSAYRQSCVEYWLPSGMTMYSEVERLVPNHFLDCDSGEQVRFWPHDAIEQREPKEVAYEVAEGLSERIIAACRRMSVALPLTAGWDSRVLLAASRRVIDSIFVYTLLYRDVDHASVDVEVPNALSKRLGFKHHTIDCKSIPDPQFISTYMGNSCLSHHDWGIIANGLLKGFPQGRVALKGNCSEIARCFYWKYGAHPPIESVEALLAFEPGWREMGEISGNLDRWLRQATNVCQATNIDILDLFYWEQRMGSWQAQGQLEWDIAQDVLTPYNSRELLSLMLSVSSKNRAAPDYVLYRKILEESWPEVLAIPINPIRGIRFRSKVLIIRVLRFFSLHRLAGRYSHSLRQVLRRLMGHKWLL
jgi:hypothetical protein